jgi:CheY-like chemotaxis protein
MDFEPVKFLIVDDDEVSIMKIKRAIKKAHLGNPVFVAMDGHEFLKEIREDPNLHNVVVFVLTTSNSETDIQAAYEKNVAGYILKENSEHSLIEKINLLERFSNLVVLPK